jgi:ABC-2 type transport system permease protein/sodium transport system permease protein
MSCLALLFPANFLVSNSLRSFAEESMTLWLVLAAVALIVLFIGAPLLFAWLQKVRIRSGFRLSTAVLLAFVGAILLGLSIWPFSHEIVLIQKFLGITALSEVQIKGAQEIIERLRQVPLVVILLTLAVTPAVCEEFFFRGYLFGALRQTMRPWKTIVVSALLFGAFHVVTTTSLSVERFVPSTLMGLVLGWICWRSGSVFPGMVLHACHNGFLLTVLYFQEELAANGWGIQEEAHMPPTWLATAAVVVVVGVALVWVVTKKKEEALTSELGENH